MKDRGFEGDADFLDIMATKAFDPADQCELHRLADTYRKLAADQPIIDRSKSEE